MISAIVAGIALLLLALLVAIRESAMAVILPLLPAAVVIAAVALLALLLRRRADGWAVALGLAAAALVGHLFWFQHVAASCSDVRFTGGDGFTLAGTLCLPPAAGVVPGVALVHGSGRQTRDEHLFHARYLARRGIAALAYDKRGAGASGGDTYATDYAGYAQDAAAAVDLLAGHARVNAQRVGLVGYSEAEWVIPQVTGHTDAVAFAVIVGPSALTPGEQVGEEIALRLQRKHYPTTAIDQALAVHQAYQDYLRGELDAAALETLLARSRDHDWFGAAEDLFDQVHPREDFQWWRSVMDFDAMPGWRRLDVPVLVLKGSKDDRSEAERVIAAFDETLTRGQTRLFPGADHMLLHWPLGERLPPPRFAAGYPQLIAEWINGLPGSSSM